MNPSPLLLACVSPPGLSERCAGVSMMSPARLQFIDDSGGLGAVVVRRLKQTCLRVRREPGPQHQTLRNQRMVHRHQEHARPIHGGVLADHGGPVTLQNRTIAQ